MQRVAVARALVARPAVVLADEPTGNLDSQSSAEVLDLLRSLSDQDGAAVVMVTHDPAAARYGTRELHLVDGRARAVARSCDAQRLAVLPAHPPRRFDRRLAPDSAQRGGVALGVTVVLGTLMLKTELVRPFEAFGPALAPAAEAGVVEVSPNSAAGYRSTRSTGYAPASSARMQSSRSSPP